MGTMTAGAAGRGLISAPRSRSPLRFAVVAGSRAAAAISESAMRFGVPAAACVATSRGGAGAARRSGRTGANLAGGVGSPPDESGSRGADCGVRATFAASGRAGSVCGSGEGCGRNRGSTCGTRIASDGSDMGATLGTSARASDGGKSVSASPDRAPSSRGRASHSENGSKPASPPAGAGSKSESARGRISAWGATARAASCAR